MNRNLRMQELRSQQALTRVRERAAVQEMELMMQQNDLQIQYRADMTKAMSNARLAASPTIPVPGPDGSGTFEMPNPKAISQEDAAFQFVLPVVAKYEPDKVPSVLQNIATAKYRTEANQALVQQRESSVKVNEARVKEIEARVTQLQKGKTGVDPEWVRNIQFMEQRRNQPFSPEELDTMWRIHSGQDARAAVQPAQMTEMEYITKQLPSARRAERSELKTKYRTDAELIEELRTQFRSLKGADDGEELIFVLDPSGKRTRIKRRDLERALQKGFKEVEE